MAYRHLYQAILIFSLILFTYHLGFAGPSSKCLMSDALKDPQLSNNANFWNEYASLTPEQQASASELQRLIDKYKSSSANPHQTPSASVPTRTLRLEIDKKGESELKKLPENLKGKLDDFLDLALQPDGLQQIRNNPGRWNLEKLPQFGSHSMSVRLNDSYRVLFEPTPEGIRIRRINREQIHRK